MRSTVNLSNVSAHLQEEEYSYQAEHRPTVKCSTRDVVEFAPPPKVPSPDDILEDEAHREPTRVVDADCRRDERNAIENDWRADVFHPRIGTPPLPEPEWKRQERANDNGVELRVVDGLCPELTIWSDETPGACRQ